MLKPHISVLILICVMPGTASALPMIDPGRVASGIGSIIGIGGGGGSGDLIDETLGRAEEGLDLFDAAEDLMREAEVDENLLKEMDSHVVRLEAMQRDLEEVRNTKRSTREFLEFDIHRARTLSQKLRYTAQKIRQGKKIYDLFRGSKAKTQVRLQTEDLRVSYQTLDEMRNIRVLLLNQYLEETERDTRLKSSMQRVLDEELSFEKKRISSLMKKSQFRRGRR